MGSTWWVDGDAPLSLCVRRAGLIARGDEVEQIEVLDLLGQSVIRLAAQVDFLAEMGYFVHDPSSVPFQN